MIAVLKFTLKFVIGIALLICFLIGVARMLAPDPPQRQIIIQPRKAEKKWLTQRFQYHWISGCIEENGEFYFIRDGRKCGL